MRTGSSGSTGWEDSKLFQLLAVDAARSEPVPQRRLQFLRVFLSTATRLVYLEDQAMLECGARGLATNDLGIGAASQLVRQATEAWRAPRLCSLPDTGGSSRFEERRTGRSALRPGRAP